MKILVALSCLTLCDSMDFSRQEYWSEWPCLSPGDNAEPGIKPRSPTLQADSLLSEPPGKPEVSTGHIIFCASLQGHLRVKGAAMPCIVLEGDAKTWWCGGVAGRGVG